MLQAFPADFCLEQAWPQRRHHGAIPTVCVFRPLAGTDYKDVLPPKTEDMVPVFRRLYEATMERGLPVGVASNIHVSLVMLPEECRGLSNNPNRHWLGELKLKAMRKAFAYRFNRELRKADARQQATSAA